MASIGPSLLVCPFSSGLASVFLQSQVCDVRLSVKGWVDQSSDGLLSLVLFFYWCWQRWYRVSQMDIQTIDNQGWSPRNHLTNLTFKKNLMGSFSLSLSVLLDCTGGRLLEYSTYPWILNAHRWNISTMASQTNPYDVLCIRNEREEKRDMVSTIWVFDKIGNFIFRLFEGSPKWKREIGFCERLFKALLIG